MTEIFPNITNNMALNFLNTRLFRNGKMVEIIQSVECLKAWSEVPMDDNESYNTQLSIFNTFVENMDELKPIINFRSEFYHLLTSYLRNELTESDLKNRIEEATLNNPFSLIFVDKKVIYVPAVSGIEGIQSLIYLSLSELIESGDINKLSHCANDGCPLLFINKNGRRKWCSMKICGNRAKVERFESKKTNS